MSGGTWPENVGIKAIEFVFPKLYVDQTELEKFDGVSVGKYTIGFGQKEMGFCSELEDINSLCLTAFNCLMESYDLKYEDIGRLDVGTETLVDKSKSVKSVLMRLFKESGNFHVDGLDTTNACYGGTQALFNAIDWVESRRWDGRLAVVIAGDIAVYAKGNARPTGGCGAVAMLVGPNAALVLEHGLNSIYMTDVYDFYKPDLTSEYPVVNGKLSIECYFSALDNCYREYVRKSNDQEFAVTKLDAFVFHSPFCKLVQKSLARLVLNDYVRCSDKSKHFPGLERFEDVVLKNTYFDKDVETQFLKCSSKTFEKMTEPSLLLAKRVGNMYTASVYSCLISYLISTPANELPGKRIGVFSYGSGLAAAMFSFQVKGGADLSNLIRNCRNINERLDSRKVISPQEFSDILEQRQRSLHLAPFASERSIDELFPGTWYLTAIDEQHRRTYARVNPLEY